MNASSSCGPGAAQSATWLQSISPSCAKATALVSIIVLPGEEPQMLGGLVAVARLVEPAPVDR